mmetsp:Transcript_4983/g.12037  ORF Transcript_4983/g.12037 Transcript_4983/m.12037 type:complete len:324 (-) Transcript_4983:185-1156(-)
MMPALLTRAVPLFLLFCFHATPGNGFVVHLNAPVAATRSGHSVQRGLRFRTQSIVGGGGRGQPPGQWWSRSNAGGFADDSKHCGGRGCSRLLALGAVAKGLDGIEMARAQRRMRRPVTNFFLITNLCVFVLDWLMKGAALEAGAKINYMITVNGQYYRFFTPMFLHVGLLHLFVNSMSLNAVGPSVEGFFGSERTAITYILAGVAGNVASFLLSPNAKSVGASGAIFGLVGALGVFLSRHDELLGDSGRSGLSSILQTCAFNLMIGLIPGSQIDNWGHIGGALGGAAVALLIGPNLKLKESLMGRRLIDEPWVPLPFLRKAGG